MAETPTPLSIPVLPPPVPDFGGKDSSSPAADEELRLLKERVASLKAEREKDQEKLQQLRVRLSEQEMALAAKASQPQDDPEATLPTESVTSLSNQAQSLLDALAAEHQIARELQAQLSKVGATSFKLSTQLHTIQENITTNQGISATGNDDLQKEFSLAQERIKALKEQREGDQQKLQELRVKLAQVQTGAASAEPKPNPDLVEALQVAQERIKALKEQRESDQQKLQELRVNANQNEQTVLDRPIPMDSSLAEDLLVAQERIKALKDQRETDQQKLQELRINVRTEADEVHRLRSELSDKPTAVTKVSEIQASEQMRRERERADAALAALNKTRAQLAEVEKEKHRLENEVQRLNSEKASVRGPITSPPVARTQASTAGTSPTPFIPGANAEKSPPAAPAAKPVAPVPVAKAPPPPPPVKQAALPPPVKGAPPVAPGAAVTPPFAALTNSVGANPPKTTGAPPPPAPTPKPSPETGTTEPNANVNDFATDTLVTSQPPPVLKR